MKSKFLWIRFQVSNVCSVKFRSKHSTVLLLCLLLNLMEQSLDIFNDFKFLQKLNSRYFVLYSLILAPSKFFDRQVVLQ